MAVYKKKSAAVPQGSKASTKSSASSLKSNIKKSKPSRTRNWALILYPDSAPENWQDIIDSWHISWACSPLHDKDINPDSEEDKKAHWHIALCFDGVKSRQQIEELVKPLNCPKPQEMNSLVGTIRYFIHKDHPHKYQYPIEDIRAFGNIDIYELLKPSKSLQTSFLKQIIEIINEKDFYEYQDVWDYLSSEEPDLFETFIDRDRQVSKYLNSRRYKNVKE